MTRRHFRSRSKARSDATKASRFGSAHFGTPALRNSAITRSTSARSLNGLRACSVVWLKSGDNPRIRSGLDARQPSNQSSFRCWAESTALQPPALAKAFKRVLR